VNGAIHATSRPDLTPLSLTEPVAKAVRRDDIEHLPRDIVMAFDVELGECLVEPIRIELREQRLKAV
jgi:hypothetical protein